MLRHWLNSPHVREWWRGEPVTFTDIVRKYGPCIDGVVATRVCIIERRGRGPDPVLPPHVDHRDWDRAVASKRSRSRLPHRRSQPVWTGVGSAAIASFGPRVFAWYPNVAVIVAAPQVESYASRRALEKTGFALLEERQLDSDDPSDAGPSAIYALTRPS